MPCAILYFMAPPLLIDNQQQAQRSFWTAKAFHGYISKEYQIQCSYETVVRFFHKQGFALKTPQPWPDKQDEQPRERFVKELEQLFIQPDVEFGLPMNLVLRAIQGLESAGIKKGEKRSFGTDGNLSICQRIHPI